jgi:hypothetical protein
MVPRVGRMFPGKRCLQNEIAFVVVFIIKGPVVEEPVVGSNICQDIDPIAVGVVRVGFVGLPGVAK